MRRLSLMPLLGEQRDELAAGSMQPRHRRWTLDNVIESKNGRKPGEIRENAAFQPRMPVRGEAGGTVLAASRSGRYELQSASGKTKTVNQLVPVEKGRPVAAVRIVGSGPPAPGRAAAGVLTNRLGAQRPRARDQGAKQSEPRP